VTLLANRVVQADTGVYSMTGAPAELDMSEGFDVGHYSITGQPALLKRLAS
jgi:hypothetical protein